MRSYREGVIAFRNRIIHKGMIPTYEQTYDYGEIIYNEIGELTTELKTKFRKNIDNHRYNIAKKQFEKNKGTTLGLIASVTMFSISNELSIQPFSTQFLLF